jgi:hypothetical protein
MFLFPKHLITSHKSQRHTSCQFQELAQLIWSPAAEQSSPQSENPNPSETTTPSEQLSPSKNPTSSQSPPSPGSEGGGVGGSEGGGADGSEGGGAGGSEGGGAAKLELLHGKDYEEGKRRVEHYKHVATALKKRSVVGI